MKSVHWPFDGCVVTFHRARTHCAQTPRCCTKCNRLPINGQCTNQHRPLVDVPNVTDYPSMASVPISTDPSLLYQMQQTTHQWPVYQSAQTPRCCTKCNRLPINGQCTNQHRPLVALPNATDYPQRPVNQSYFFILLSLATGNMYLWTVNQTSLP